MNNLWSLGDGGDPEVELTQGGRSSVRYKATTPNPAGWMLYLEGIAKPALAEVVVQVQTGSPAGQSPSIGPFRFPGSACIWLPWPLFDAKVGIVSGAAPGERFISRFSFRACRPDAYPRPQSAPLIGVEERSVAAGGAEQFTPPGGARRWRVVTIGTPAANWQANADLGGASKGYEGIFAPGALTAAARSSMPWVDLVPFQTVIVDNPGGAPITVQVQYQITVA